MTARKLTDSEKKDIVHLYRTTGETSSTLAQRYEVSTSTVSRLLKSTLPADEYEALIQQKRSIRNVDVAEVSLAESPQEPLLEAEPVVEPAIEVEDVEEVAITPQREKPRITPPVIRRSKPRSQDNGDSGETAEQLEMPVVNSYPVSKSDASNSGADVESEVLKEILSQSLIEPEEEADDLDDELDEDLDEDDDDFEDDELPNKPLLVGNRIKEGFLVQILPLADAPIPRTCYLVVDRSAELVAPPLKDFGDLGQIPEAEIQQKTLPIFDNHRIAKRYSNPRTQRVIKLPDGRVLSKTSSHLQAKGITRLLIDGRVYSLN